MTGVALGLIAALLWGSADILSSLAARAVGAWRVTLLAQTSGCLALVGGSLFLSWRFPQVRLFTALPAPTLGVLVLHAMVLGALAAGSYAALYRSLAQGPLAVVSPIIAANGAVTLLTAILFTHEQIDLEEGLVLVIILLGVVLAAVQTDDNQQTTRLLTRSGIGWSLLAMMGLGLFGFGIGASAHTTHAFLLLLCTRCWALLFLDLSAHAFRQQAPAPPLRLKHLVFIVGAGSAEMAGLVIFSLDARVVTTGIAGVLASVNNVLPLVFGVLVYRERPGKRLLGVPLIITGLAALSLPSTLRIMVLQSMLLTLLVGRLLWMTIQQGIQTYTRHTNSAGHALSFTLYALVGAGVLLALLVAAMSTHFMPGIKVVSVPGAVCAMIVVVMVYLIHPASKYDGSPGSKSVRNEDAKGVLDEVSTPPEASWNLIIVSSKESQYTRVGSSTQQVRVPSLRWAGSPASRSIREQKKHGMWPRNTEVLLLSSRYGLSTPGALTCPLPTAQEVDQEAWLWAVRQQLGQVLACKPYSEIVVYVYPHQQAVFAQECFAPEQHITILPAHVRGGDALQDWILEHICGETQPLLPLAVLDLSPTTLHLLWKHDIYSLWEVLERDGDQVLHLLNGRLECFRELELQLCRAGLMEFSSPTRPRELSTRGLF